MIKSVFKIYSLLDAGQKKKLLKLQLLVAITAILELASVASIAPFMSLVADNRILTSSEYLNYLYTLSSVHSIAEFIFLLGLLLLAILVISTAFSVFTVWRLSTYAYDTGTEIADRLFRYYMENDWLFHVENNSSYLIKQIAGDSQRVTNNVLQPLLQMNAKIVLAVVLCSALVVYMWEIAVGGFVVFSLSYLALFKIVRSKLDRNGKLISTLTADRYKIMAEVFGGIKELKLMSRLNESRRIFEVKGHQLAQCQGINTAIGSTPRYIMELITFGSILFLLLLLYVRYDGNIGEILPIISVCALAGFKLLPAFQTIYTSLAQIRGNMAAFDSIEADLENAKVKLESSAIVKSESLPTFKSIELENIGLCYPMAREYSVSGVSVSIKRNTTVAFVGASGAGKSTLIDVILGLLNPSEGRLLFAGVPMSEINVKSWQAMIGYVPQTIFLKEGSIIDNVAYGLHKDDISIDLVKVALRKAELLEYVQSLPKGIYTEVGEHGVKLSGGQRQRLGIARALYHDPDILVLDEATSALDGMTERAIMNAIEDMSAKKTIIIIAHRINTIRSSDMIYMLDNGQVVDSGSYQKLKENNATFRKMAEFS